MLHAPAALDPAYRTVNIKFTWVALRTESCKASLDHRQTIAARTERNLMQSLSCQTKDTIRRDDIPSECVASTGGRTRDLPIFFCFTSRERKDGLKVGRIEPTMLWRRQRKKPVCKDLIYSQNVTCEAPLTFSSLLYACTRLLLEHFHLTARRGAPRRKTQVPIDSEVGRRSITQLTTIGTSRIAGVRSVHTILWHIVLQKFLCRRLRTICRLSMMPPRQALASQRPARSAYPRHSVWPVPPRADRPRAQADQTADLPALA